MFGIKIKKETIMKNKLDEKIQLEIDSGKIKIKIKKRCFVCGCKIKDRVDPLVRYSKQGNTCDECSTCSNFSKSSVPEKAERYRRWCLKLNRLRNARNKKAQIEKVL